MGLAQNINQKATSYMKYLFYILLSYISFIFIIGVFGDGYTALSSLIIVMSSCFLIIFLLMSVFSKLIFKKVDYFIVGFVISIQALVGALHFIFFVNTNYFIDSTPGVEITNGLTTSFFDGYYWDVFYFTWLMDSIAEYRIENGYFATNFLEAPHKNYLMAYLVSDIFYFGDNYVLNFQAINILSLFYSGILLSLLSMKLFNIHDINKLRSIFYLTILQPIAWIPSHSMRDILGVFFVIISVCLIFFSITRTQKLISYTLSLALVFQHRSVYFISILGGIFLRNIFLIKKELGLITIISFVLVFSTLVAALSGDLVSTLITIFQTSQQNSLITQGSSSIVFQLLKLIVGPFPWTQYYDGSVSGYAAHYSSTIILQAAWHLCILYFLILNIKTILSKKISRHYLYIILLFGIPAIFSLGGMNLYLMPSYVLAIALLSQISLKRFFLTYIFIVSIYIVFSTVYFFLK
jgi:hypothetical protein